MARSDYTPPNFVDVTNPANPPAGAVALDAAHLNAMAQAIGNSAKQYAVNVRDFGAKGDGTTDDSAAFAACRDAAIATARTSEGGGNPPVTTSIVIPPGRYLLTQNDALMSPSAGTGGLSGLMIHGGGVHATTLVWAPTVTSTTDPTKGNLFSANKRALRFHIADFCVEVQNAAANVFYFTDDGSGAQNEGMVFDRLFIDGSCQRAFGFDGGATANLNSEMTFNNVSARGAYGDAFMRVGGISGVFNQQNQFLNYWINNSSFQLLGGTLFRFDRGGAAHFTNGSWSASNSSAPAMTFISMPSQNFNNTSATSFSFRNVRFEPKASNHVIIDCRMGQGQVNFVNCTDTASLQFAGTETYNLHRYTGGVPWGPGAGPTVRYQDCALAGYHSYDGAGAVQTLGGFVYDGCYVYRGGNSGLAAITQEKGNNGVLQWSNGRPRFAFRSGWNYDDDTSATPAPATTPLVRQNAVAVGTPAAPVATPTITLPSVTAGHGLTLEVSVWNPAAVNSVTDSAGGTWTRAVTQTSANCGTTDIWVCHAHPGSAGTLTATVTLASAQETAINLTEWSTPLTVNTTAKVDSAAATVASLGVAATSGDVVVSLLSTASNATPAVNTPATRLASAAGTDISVDPACVVATATGTTTITYATMASVQYAMVVASFHPA